MKSSPAPKARRDVWGTMGLCERAVRKAEKSIDAQIIYDRDQNRHGGVLRLIEARRILTRVHELCSDHEDML